MSEPKSIGDIILAMAANSTDEYGKLLRKCPFIQKELMRQGRMSFEDLTDTECDRLIDYDQVETEGQAADITTDSPAELARLIIELSLPFDQLILYPSFIHISHKHPGPQQGQILYNQSYKGERI